jgi:hypothetical protein
MRAKSFTQMIYLAIIVAVLTTSVEAWAHKNGQKALVRFLATSTVIHSAAGGSNEDTYLAELTLAPQGAPLLTRLIDSYPSAASALSKEVLTSANGSELRVVRDMSCDRPYSKIILRTAPGNPMAIMREPLGYQPAMLTIPAPDTVLPCYRLVRG